MNYLTNCTVSEGHLIDDMIENEKEIGYNELLQNVTKEELNKVFPIYVGIEDILTLESDYATSYYSSFYNDEKCVFVVHSSIEYIFT